MAHLAGWTHCPPALDAALSACLSDTGSLTQRLQSYHADFAVSVLYQGPTVAYADEAVPLGLAPGAPLYVREVALSLAQRPVVYARSISRLDCPIWLPILDRGSRSLGLTLFGGLANLQRQALEYQWLDNHHPLAQAAHALQAAPYYPARRCCFQLEEAKLLVCEVFLPNLKDFVP